MTKTYTEQIVSAAETGQDPDWLIALIGDIPMDGNKLSDQMVSAAFSGRDPVALQTIISNLGLTPTRTLSSQLYPYLYSGEDAPDIIALAEGNAPDLEGFPDATNTGYTSDLGDLATDFEGGITYSTEGGVIEGKNITGHIRVSANNVTIRNCLITASSFWCVFVEEGVTGFRMFDCELDGEGVTGKGFLGTGIVMRCNIHHCADSIGFTAANCLAAGNYLHDNLTNDPDPHYDGMDVTGSNTLVVHNTIINPATQTSAIFVENEAADPEANPTTNIRIADNFLSGGGYTIYTGGPGTTDVQFLDNTLTSGFYGYVNEFGPLTEPATFTGNVSSVDGSPVNETVAGPLACYGVPLVEASEGVAITPFTVTAKGGTPPYTFAKVATWPTGLSVHATTGVVSGTPTQSGSFPNAAIRVTDALDNETELSMWGLEVSYEG